MVHSEFAPLKAHFGDAYLVKSLEDLSIRGEESIVIKLLHEAEPIGKRISRTKKKKGQEQEKSYLEWIWEYVSNALISLFSSTTELLKNISWKVIVEAGNVPAYFDAVIAVLNKMATASTKQLERYAKSVHNRLVDMWKYVHSMMSEPNEEVYEAEQESYNLIGLISDSASFIVRKVASGLVLVFEALRGFIANAIDEMAYGISALMESCYESTLPVFKKTKRFIMKFGFAVMTATGDMVSLMKRGKLFMKHYMSAIIKMISNLVAELYGYIQHIDMSVIQETITNNWMFKAGYGAVLKAEAAATWIANHTRWLSNSLRIISTIGYEWFYRCVQSLTVLFGKMFNNVLEPIFEFYEKMQVTSKTRDNVIEALKELDSIEKDETDELPEEVSGYAGNVKDYAKKIIQNLDRREDERVDALFNRSYSEIFGRYLRAGELLTSLYEGDENVEESKDMEQFIMETTGFKSLYELTSIWNDLQEICDETIISSMQTLFANFKMDKESEEMEMEMTGDGIDQIKGPWFFWGQDKNTTTDLDPRLTQALKNYQEAVEKRTRKKEELIREQEIDLKEEFEATREWIRQKREDDDMDDNDIRRIKSDRYKNAVFRTASISDDILADYDRQIEKAAREVKEIKKLLGIRERFLLQRAYTMFGLVLLIGGGGTYLFMRDYLNAFSQFATPEEIYAMFFKLPYPEKKGDKETNKQLFARIWERIVNTATTVVKKGEETAKVVGIIAPTTAEAINIPTLWGWAVSGQYLYFGSLLNINVTLVNTAAYSVGLLFHFICALVNFVMWMFYNDEEEMVLGNYNFTNFVGQSVVTYGQIKGAWFAMSQTVASNRIAGMQMATVVVANIVWAYLNPLGALYKYSKGTGKKEEKEKENQTAVVVKQKEMIRKVSDARRKFKMREITLEEFGEIVQDLQLENLTHLQRREMQTNRPYEDEKYKRAERLLKFPIEHPIAGMAPIDTVFVSCKVCKAEKDLIHCDQCDVVYCCKECSNHDLHDLI